MGRLQGMQEHEDQQRRVRLENALIRLTERQDKYFWVPVIISVASLIVAIFALMKAK